MDNKYFLKGTDADPVTKGHFIEREKQDKTNPAIQKSEYNRKDRAKPDNNIFFDERSNPLSSKGN